jgi:hypothetical protein
MRTRGGLTGLLNVEFDDATGAGEMEAPIELLKPEPLVVKPMYY